MTPSAGCGTGDSVPSAMPSRVAPAGPRPTRRGGRAARRRCRGGRISSVTRPVHRPGVHALLERERARARDLVAGADRGLHRRGAPPGREQGEVQVHPAVRGDVEGLAAQQVAVGHHGAAVGRERGAAARGTPGSEAFAGVRTGMPGLVAQRADGAALRPLRAPDRGVRARHDGDDLVPGAREQAAQGGQGGLGGAREDDAHVSGGPAEERVRARPDRGRRRQVEPRRPADLGHRLAPRLGVELVEEEHPVEVVGLVLDRAGDQRGALDASAARRGGPSRRRRRARSGGSPSGARGWTGSPRDRTARSRRRRSTSG